MGQPQAMRTRIGDFFADVADLVATPSGAAFFALTCFGVFHYAEYRELAIGAGGAAIAYMTSKPAPPRGGGALPDGETPP